MTELVQVDIDIHLVMWLKDRDEAIKDACDIEPLMRKALTSDDTIFAGKDISFVLNYPLTNPASFTISRPLGWRAKDVISAIANAYAEVYNTEDKTVKEHPVTPEGERGFLMNRNKTDGEYGIWGHDMADLYLEGFTIDKDGKVEVWMGS